MFLLFLIHSFFFCLKFKRGSACCAPSMGAHCRSRWPSSLGFFSPAGMHHLSSGVHVRAVHVHRSKFKTSTCHYVVLEAHHFFFFVSLNTWVSHQVFGCLVWASVRRLELEVELKLSLSCTSSMCIQICPSFEKRCSLFGSVHIHRKSLPYVYEETERPLWHYGWVIWFLDHVLHKCNFWLEIKEKKVCNAVTFVHLIILKFLCSMSRFM